MTTTLIILAALFIIIRSSARLLSKKARKVSSGISYSNNRIIFTEAIILFIGLAVLLVTVLGTESSSINQSIYYISSAILLLMALVSLLNPKKIIFIPRMCVPGISIAAILIIIGSLLV